jgi:hypothetical protein
MPVVAPVSAGPDPAQQDQLAAMALSAHDVAANAQPLAVPEASDFDSLLQALYAECDYYTPVGVDRSAHLLTAYQSGSTVVYDDLATYPAGTAAGVVTGMATSLSRCHDLEVTHTTHNGARASVLGRYRVERTSLPAGLPADAVALTYERTDSPGTTWRAVLLSQGDTLRVVLATAPSLEDSDTIFTQASIRGWSLMRDSA